MKKLKITSWLAGALFTIAPLALAFTSKETRQFTAEVTIATSGGGSGSGSLTFLIPQLLGSQVVAGQANVAFFGKNVVLPIQITNGAAPAAPAGGYSTSVPDITGAPGTGGTGLQVTMLYQLFDSGGVAQITTEQSIPIVLQADISNPRGSIGMGVIPVNALQGARHGGLLKYHFQLQSGANKTPIMAAGGAPFLLQFVNSMSFPVGANPNGSTVVLPDPYVTDGNTSIIFGPGALSGPGTLVARYEDPATLPGGPGGLAGLTVFDLGLQGTSLLSQAQLNLSYPANLDGTLVGSNGSPDNLVPYWLQGSNWEVMGPKTSNTTLHVVSAPTTHFSTFGLFLGAGNSAAELRPRQRVLTPNHDGKNDSISFAGINGTDVRIYDVKGRRVKTLAANSNLIWDGTDDSGAIVESGLYIYQYVSQGDRVSGVILVAK